jgi:hypothetical protein
MDFGKVTKPYWDDRPVAIIGGGPSVQDLDLELLRGAHVLAVKDAILSVPWADASVGVGDWSDCLDLQGRVYWARSDVVAAPTKNITILKQVPGVPQMSDDPSVIYGVSSEFASMQICIHKRAKQIVLFGFDFEGPTWTKAAEYFSVFVPYLTKHGIDVVNACPSSSIRFFQKVGLRDGVDMLHRKPLACVG